MATACIITTPNEEIMTDECKQLYAGLISEYDSVILINPKKTGFCFIRGNKTPTIYYNGELLPKIDTAFVRSTKYREKSICVLVHALQHTGCNVVDDIDEIYMPRWSKLLTSIERWERNVGTTTYIAFSRKTAFKMASECIPMPCIYKPFDGAQSEDITPIQDTYGLKQNIREFFEERESTDDPYYCQPFINIQKEYRILVHDGLVVAMARKIKKKNMSNPDNVASGSRFKPVRNNTISTFVESNVNNKGILGVDLCIDDGNNYHIIETNRAPQWTRMNNRSKRNLVKEMILREKQKIANAQ